MLRTFMEILAIMAFIAALAFLAWFATDKAVSAELTVSATVLPEPVTVNAEWIAQSPDTHWPEETADVRVDRIGDVMLVTVSF